jgi:hypothetical protein
MKNKKERVSIMDPELTTSIAQIVAGITLLAMAWFLTKRMNKNRAEMLESNAPKIAGEDEMSGGARNPQQFEEPDEAALDMMSELLGEDEDSTDES